MTVLVVTETPETMDDEKPPPDDSEMIPADEVIVNDGASADTGIPDAIGAIGA